MQLNRICADFKANSNISDSEVMLFRQLAKSIGKYSSSIFIDETHGRKALVKFDSPISKQEETCEISDLLIVTLSADRMHVRATFWQAKRQPSPKWRISSELGNLDFGGQFNQWELLAYRRAIKRATQFSPPVDLLSAASSPSIGSFGVFYPVSLGVEVNYSIAEMVVAASTKKKTTMIINEKLQPYLFGLYERIACKTILEFIQAISQFQVGALLNMAIPSDQWLLKYVLKKSKIPTLFNGVSGFDGLDADTDGSDDDGVSVLIIPLEAD